MKKTVDRPVRKPLHLTAHTLRLLETRDMELIAGGVVRKYGDTYSGC